MLRAETQWGTIKLTPTTISITETNQTKTTLINVLINVDKIEYKYNVYDDDGNLLPYFLMGFSTPDLVKALKPVKRRDGVDIYMCPGDSRIFVQPRAFTRNSRRTCLGIVNSELRDYAEYEFPTYTISRPTVRVQPLELSGTCTQAASSRCLFIDIIGYSEGIDICHLSPQRQIIHYETFGVRGVSYTTPNSQQDFTDRSSDSPRETDDNSNRAEEEDSSSAEERDNSSRRGRKSKDKNPPLEGKRNKKGNKIKEDPSPKSSRRKEQPDTTKDSSRRGGSTSSKGKDITASLDKEDGSSESDDDGVVPPARSYDNVGNRIRIPIKTVKALAKINNISPQGTMVKIFHEENQPLCIRADVGSYGEFSMYIRSVDIKS